jgi:hypothetical protein
MGRTANVRKKKSGGARVKTRVADAQIKKPRKISAAAIAKMKANAGKPGYDQYGQLANSLENRGGRGTNTLGTTLGGMPMGPAKPGRGRAETNMPKKGKGNRRAVDGGGFRNKAFGMGRAGGGGMKDLAFGMGRDQRGMGMGKEQFLEGRGFRSGIEGIERGGTGMMAEGRGAENVRDILAAKQNQQRGLSQAQRSAISGMVGASLGNRTAGKKGTVTSRAADAIAKRGGKTNVKGGTKKINVRSNPKVAAQMAAAFTKKMGTTQGGFRLPPKSQIKK